MEFGFVAAGSRVPNPGAIRAKTTISDFGPIDQKPFGQPCIQTGGRSDRAIYIDDQTACPANKVVMIVACACFVKHWPAIDGEAPQKASFSKVRKAIVNPLVRHIGQHGSDIDKHGRCADMRPTIHRIENGNTLARDAQACAAYFIFSVHDRN